MRAKPIAVKIKEALNQVNIPPKIANYKVPQTNEDITKAMTTNAKYLDTNLQRMANLILKATSPMIYFISDVLNKKISNQQMVYVLQVVNRWAD